MVLNGITLLRAGQLINTSFIDSINAVIGCWETLATPTPTQVLTLGLLEQTNWLPYKSAYFENDAIMNTSVYK